MAERWVLRRDNFLVESTHILGLERRSKRGQLVKNAAKRPNIALEVVGSVLPDLRACVVRRACLSVQESAFVRAHDLGHIEVGELALTLTADEYVGALDVPVHDVQIVQRLQAAQTLDQCAPELPLREARLSFEVALDLA